MGIEDFNLELAEHADRILLVTESLESKQQLGEIFEHRSYQWKAVENLGAAAELAGRELFDLVIVEICSAQLPASDIIDNFKAKDSLKRCPLIVLHPEGSKERYPTARGASSITVLSSPVEPSELLVKLATQLRLRKASNNQLRFDAKLSAQNAQLRDLNNRFRKELKEAQAVQQSMLPAEHPTDPNCALYATYIPLEAVGGDIYDLWRISERTFGLFVGDVTGHGLPAAFIGAMTKMALSYANQQNPEQTLAEMNAGLAEHMPEERFVTVAAAIYNAESGELKIARGGHPPSYIWRAETGEVEEVCPKGMALGMLAESKFELYQTKLNPGDKLLMITDGITEAQDMNGEMIGISGLGECFKRAAVLPDIKSSIENILQQIDAYSGGRVIKDDQTLIGLECLK